MKKENMAKKVLMKAVIGFPVGVTLLIISYAIINYVIGEDIFHSELNQLHNVNTLIFQIIAAGISGYFLFISFYIFSFLHNKDLENKLIEKPLYKSVFPIILFSMCIIIGMSPFGNTGIFSENIRTLNIVILVIIYTLSITVFAIKSAIEQLWIKKINQKIKERNN